MVDPGTDSQPNLPSEIAGYRIVRLLGEGGMSVVYAAMQKQPKRMVALVYTHYAAVVWATA